MAKREGQRESKRERNRTPAPANVKSQERSKLKNAQAEREAEREAERKETEETQGEKSAHQVTPNSWLWALATLSGCINGAAFVFFGPLCLIANLPLLLALREARSLGQAAALGAWVGALGGFHIFGVLSYGWWIFWAFSLYTASQMMIFGTAVYYFRERIGTWQSPIVRLLYELLVPCLIWTLTEWLRTVGPVALPASYVGCIADVAWLKPLLGWASVIGGLGVSALIALVPSALFLCMTPPRENESSSDPQATQDVASERGLNASRRPQDVQREEAREGRDEGAMSESSLSHSVLQRRANRIFVGMSGVMIILGLSIWGHFVPPLVAGEPIKVAGVQGGFTNQVYEAALADPALSVEIVKTYETLNERAREKEVDLIVWAESVIRVPLIFNPPLRARLLPQDEEDPTLIGGILHTERDGTRYNLAISAENKVITDRYIKVKTVPGVEEAFTPGERWEPLATRWGPIGVLICFEAIYPHAGREMVSAGARMLLVLSNDAGFGETPISHHMTNRAAVRAVETGRWLLRVGQAGVTTLFDPQGASHGRLPSFQAEVLYGEAQLRNELTPYVRFGLVWLWSFVFLLLWPILWFEGRILYAWWRGELTAGGADAIRSSLDRGKLSQLKHLTSRVIARARQVTSRRDPSEVDHSSVEAPPEDDPYQ